MINNLRSAVTQSKFSYDEKRYSTPLFIAHETINAFKRHNVLGLSAALSFYAMFALIPLVLLMFFLLSQLVFSSEYAILKLAIITGNLVPKLSNTIMVEVYKTAQQKAAWGSRFIYSTVGSDAVVSSDHADIVLISAENIETLLLDKSKVA